MTRLWRIKDVESIFEANRFDLADYRQAVGAYPRLSTANSRARDELGGGQPAQDAFLDLYKAAPRLAEPCPAALSGLRQLVERGRQTPEYQKLRAGSVGDLVSAAVGAEVYVDRVMKHLPDEVKEAIKQQSVAQKKADEAHRQAQAARDFSELLGQIMEQTDDPARLRDYEQQLPQATYQQEAAEARAQEMQAAADEFKAAADEAMAGHEAQVTAALNQAAGQAAQEGQQVSQVVRGFSQAAGGSGEYVDPEQVRGVMDLMARQPNLQELAELLGWARRMVRAEWRKSPRGRTELTGYRKQALVPSRMATAEMARMVSPAAAIRQDWQRRAVDNAIMHRQYEGESQEGRGPLVMVRDESGSMEGAPHALAVALEWALLEIARRDGRPFVCIPFSGAGQSEIWRAPEAGKPDMESLLHHLGHFYGGGTEPYNPLAAALDVIEADDLKADVLLLTDADFASPPADFMERLDEVRSGRPVKMVSVVIGAGGHQARKFSDKVIFVGDLLADREKLAGAVGGVV
jgi:uncharacterized protein with von Willebrand factor type A (vWA) domain